MVPSCCLITQSRLTLCNPRDDSPPGFLSMGFPGILEQVAVPSFRGSSRPRDGTCVSCIGRQIQATRKVQDVQLTPDLGLLADPWRPQDARSFREEEQAPEDPRRRSLPSGRTQHGLLLAHWTTAQATRCHGEGKGWEWSRGRVPLC